VGRLYVLGGRQRRLGLKVATSQDEWYLYEAALILEIDTDRGTARSCLEYQSPREARAGDKPAAHFHSGALIGDTLYTCTTTEVLVYQLPEFRQTGYISLPCFNDVHHVTPASDGNLLVVSTGLDMVVKVTPGGEILNEWCVTDELPYTRFSRDVDYRQVETTKPHRSHPNFAFELDNEVWATRFIQRDAVCLTSSNKRIAMNVEKPHDGVIFGDNILFTSVDGKIVVVNRRSLRMNEVIDLRQIQDSNRQVLPAWCRGLLPVDDRRVWVGFTRIRQTVFKENVRWVKTVLGEGTIAKPTHIALFDLVSMRCLEEIDLEPYGMNTIFSIFPVPDSVSERDASTPDRGLPRTRDAAWNSTSA
jgi:hypothetical protein